jgi:phosphatidylglycerophosphatase A
LTYKAPRWAWAVATGLGSGRLRPAPGTWGTLAALLFWLLLSILVATPFTNWAAAHQGLPHLRLYILAFEPLFLLAPLAMTWLAVRSSDLVLAETGEKDPGYIVADEWAGMWITLWPVRWEIARHAHRLLEPGGWRWLPTLAVPFLVFRLLDIWKPWPVYQIQALPGGTGVVADDVVAGLYGIPLVMLITPWVMALAS